MMMNASLATATVLEVASVLEAATGAPMAAPGAGAGPGAPGAGLVAGLGAGLGAGTTTAVAVLDKDMSPVTLASDWSRVARLLLLASLSVIGSVGNVFMISAVMTEDHLKQRGQLSPVA